MLQRFIAPFSLALLLAAAEPAIDKAKKQQAEKKFDEAVSTLDAAHKAKPKSVEIRKALADAHMQAGDSYMYNESLPPFRKYPAALRHYRSTLRLDPKNKKAADNIAMIEGIYKQMGRPIPR